MLSRLNFVHDASAGAHTHTISDRVFHVSIGSAAKYASHEPILLFYSLKQHSCWMSLCASSCVGWWVSECVVENGDGCLMMIHLPKVFVLTWHRFLRSRRPRIIDERTITKRRFANVHICTGIAIDFVVSRVRFNQMNNNSTECAVSFLRLTHWHTSSHLHVPIDAKRNNNISRIESFCAYTLAPNND